MKFYLDGTEINKEDLLEEIGEEQLGTIFQEADQDEVKGKKQSTFFVSAGMLKVTF